MRRDVTANAGAFIAAILFGASVVAVRVAVRDIPPLTLAILRFGQGGFLLLLFLLIWARDLLRVRGSDVPYLVLLGAIFFTIFPVTFNMSLRLTEASRGALMLATMPLWSVLLARAAKKERLSTRQMCGVLLTFAGVGVVLAERGCIFPVLRLEIEYRAPAVLDDLVRVDTEVLDVGKTSFTLGQQVIRAVDGKLLADGSHACLRKPNHEGEAASGRPHAGTAD